MIALDSTTGIFSSSNAITFNPHFTAKGNKGGIDGNRSAGFQFCTQCSELIRTIVADGARAIVSNLVMTNLYCTSWRFRSWTGTLRICWRTVSPDTRCRCTGNESVRFCPYTAAIGIKATTGAGVTLHSIHLRTITRYNNTNMRATHRIVSGGE